MLLLLFIASNFRWKCRWMIQALCLKPLQSQCAETKEAPLRTRSRVASRKLQDCSKSVERFRLSAWTFFNRNVLKEQKLFYQPALRKCLAWHEEIARSLRVRGTFQAEARTPWNISGWIARVEHFRLGIANIPNELRCCRRSRWGPCGESYCRREASLRWDRV